MERKEWTLGNQWNSIRHDHRFIEPEGTDLRGIVGEYGWLLHDHDGEQQHAHPLIAKWKDTTSWPTQDQYWYGPARDLPEPTSSWDYA